MQHISMVIAMVKHIISIGLFDEKSIKKENHI